MTLRSCTVISMLFATFATSTLAGQLDTDRLSSAAVAAALGSWEALAPMPSSRQEVGVGILQGKIYVVGGFDGSGQSVNTVERYDPLNDIWEEVAPLPAPSPLNHVAVATAGNRLYVIGGLLQSFQPVSTVYRYDAATDTWSQVAALPQARGALATATIGGLIYAAGGLPLARNTQLTVYDPATNQWATLASMPTGRDHLAAAALGGKFYAFSGRAAGVLQSSTEVFDPATGAWSTRTPIPTPRGGIGAAVVGGRAYVFGGEGNGAADSNGVFREVEEYDPVSDSWRAMAEMPDVGRHGIGAVAFGGRIYVPGGAQFAGFGPVNRNDAFTPPGQVLTTFDGAPLFAALSGVVDDIDWGPFGWFTFGGNAGPCQGSRAISISGLASLAFVDTASLISFDMGSLGTSGLLFVASFDSNGGLLELDLALIGPEECTTVRPEFTERATDIVLLFFGGAFAMDNLLHAAPQ